MSELEKLQEVAVKELLDFFNGGLVTKESENAKFSSKLAVGTLSVIGRIKATDRAHDGMQLNVIGSISENGKEFHDYIKVSMPHLNPTKKMAQMKRK